MCSYDCVCSCFRSAYLYISIYCSFTCTNLFDPCHRELVLPLFSLSLYPRQMRCNVPLLLPVILHHIILYHVMLPLYPSFSFSPSTTTHILYYYLEFLSPFTFFYVSFLFFSLFSNFFFFFSVLPSTDWLTDLMLVVFISFSVQSIIYFYLYPTFLPCSVWLGHQSIHI